MHLFSGMSFKIWCVSCLALFAVISADAEDSVSLEKVAILRTELPIGSTWEVQQSANGVSWTNLGVLVAGSGALETVRLDGFGRASSYRMMNVTSGATTVPITTYGLGVSVGATGAGEIRLLSTTNLSPAKWIHAAYAFPDADGGLRAISSVSGPQRFFRSVRPTVPLVSASVTYYQADLSATYSGFGIVQDDMPALYHDGFICAPCPEFYHKDGLAAAAGECYEFRGPFGAVTAMVADVVVNAQPGLCNTLGGYFDLGAPVFAALFPPETGIGTATRRLVPAPVSGGVKLVVVNNSGGFYYELRPYNHRAGITNLEARASGATEFVSLPRSDYNSFVWSGSPPAMPLTVRVTSRFGETITFAPIGTMVTGDRFEAAFQFSFPDPGPPTVWRIPPVFMDALHNVPGGRWFVSSYGGATTDPAYTIDRFQGAASFRISNLGGWSGVLFQHEQQFPLRPDGFLEFAIKSGSSSAVTNMAVEIDGADVAGNPATSSTVSLPRIENTWRTLRVPLGPARAPTKIQRIHIRSMTPAAQGSVLLDLIRFGKLNPV